MFSSGPGFFRSKQYDCDSSRLLHIPVIHSFYCCLLIICFSVLRLKDIWIVSRFGQLRIVQLLAFLNVVFGVLIDTFLLDTHFGMGDEV